jgi:hypothetical protein
MPRPVSAGSTPAWASEDFPAPLAPRISRKARPRSALPAACSTAALIMALRPKKMGACLNRKASLENAVRIEPVSASKFPEQGKEQGILRIPALRGDFSV